MSGVLCFTSQDGPYADGTENEASLIPQENPTFVYRNEQEPEQVQSRNDLSPVQQTSDILRTTTNLNMHKNDGPPLVSGNIPPVLDIGPFWMLLGRLFNSTIACVFLIGVTITVSISLGVISVFVVKPSPYFDKSLDAFQIPSHKSTLHLKAFELAKQDSFSSLKKRRSTDEDEINLQYLGNDAIDFDDKHNNHVKYLHAHETNKKLFMNYKKKLDLAPVNEIHRMGSSKASSNAQPLGRQRRSVRRYRSTTWKLQLVYIAQGKGDHNVFTPERLNTIHNVEMSIMRHSEFSRFCSRSFHSYDDPALEEFDYCLPPNSLMTYFYPSKIGNQIKYDGVGSELADVQGTLSWAMQQESFYWYVDTNMNSANRTSSFIRSEIYFGRPIGEDDSLPISEQVKEYNKFITSYIKLLHKSSTSEVLVLYGGTEIFDYEVSQTIQHDLMLAIPCVISITILLFVLTSFSLWLTFCGCLSIFLSFAWAYFVFHVICGIDALGLLNVVSTFVVIGIGVDDVFVFVNTFRQTEHLYDSRLRMAYTLKTAGTATFFTSVTTAGAFAANMASQIPAIYNFGLFMMLIVSFCWVTVFLLMPPALKLWHRWLHCEILCFPNNKTQKEETVAVASPGLQRVLSAHEQEAHQEQRQQQQVLTVSGQRESFFDDDIPLLDIEEDLTSTQGLLAEEDDVPIINLDSVAMSTVMGDNSAKKNIDGMTKLLQDFLKRFVADPVIKARWVIIGIYLLIVVITVTLVFQIKPASKPPALYREDTNLQQLLDLAYNFSGKDINCKSCSGFAQTVNTPFPSHKPVTLPPVHLPTMAVTTVPTIDGATSVKPTNSPGPTMSYTATIPFTKKQEVNRITQQRGKDTTKKPRILTSVTVATNPLITTKKSCTHVNLQCRFGAKCVDDPRQGPVCQCYTGCPVDLEPLCDTEGNTHVNECQMKAVSCQLEKTITVAYQGPCKGKYGVPSGSPTDNDLVPGGSGPDSGSTGPNLDHSGGNTGHASSAGVDYNPCKGGSCGNAALRPILDNTAVVYLVFGVKGVDSSNTSKEHVLNENKGVVIYDDKFDIMDVNTIRALCKICKAIAKRTDLVIDGGAECFPASMLNSQIMMQASTISECADLPHPNLMKGQRSKAIGRQHNGRLVWFAMAFESVTYMGKSSFEAYKDYMLWDQAVQSIKKDLTSDERHGTDSVFQTCDFWRQVFMEIIGVTSAIYGLAFSLLVCILAVVLFTAHIGILLIAFFTISGVILVVISLFYLFGWEMGAVEAVSLSILVGSSVDYCIHLIEGYLVAGDEIPNAETKSNGALRRWRTKQSLTTIGVSILSSAITTIIAAIPLSCTTIQLFAKFGKIVAINAFVSILFTLIACSSFLSCFAPARYKWNFKWFIISSLIVGGMFSIFILALYSLHLSGYAIPGPSGDILFS